MHWPMDTVNVVTDFVIEDMTDHKVTKHGNAMFQRRESAQPFAEHQVAVYEREDANTSYAWVALYTLNFPDAYLKQDTSTKAFLRKSTAEMAFRSTLWASSLGLRKRP